MVPASEHINCKRDNLLIINVERGYCNQQRYAGLVRGVNSAIIVQLNKYKKLKADRKKIESSGFYINNSISIEAKSHIFEVSAMQNASVRPFVRPSVCLSVCLCPYATLISCAKPAIAMYIYIIISSMNH